MTASPPGAADPPAIGIGMVGYAFMGRAHAYAYRAVSALTQAPPIVPRLVSVCGRDTEALTAAQPTLGFAETADDWRVLIDDPRIELFDNVAANALHAEPTVAAARAGKHVMCEKPLGRSADEAYFMWCEAAGAHVVHMCAFNYRFLPAIRFARELVQAGELGDIHSFRSSFLASFGTHAERDAWRMAASGAGHGALGDLGSHHIDLLRYLVGEPVSARAIDQRPSGAPPGGDLVDDSFAALLELDGGGFATLEASWLAGGHSVHSEVEITGSKASVRFTLRRLNELRIDRGGQAEEILVTEPEHPLMNLWWPHGHPLGWADSFTLELRHLLAAIAGETAIAPHGATFEDGYRCAEICDAIARSAATSSVERINFRPLMVAGPDRTTEGVA